MLAAAETVAEEAGISRGELDELTALRSDQYARALADDRAFQRPADDRAFQRRYMVEAHIPRRHKPPTVIDADEGVRPAVLDQIAALPPAARDGRLNAQHEGARVIETTSVPRFPPGYGARNPAIRVSLVAACPLTLGLRSQPR